MIGIAENTPYGGTKAWLHSFMRVVAVEQACWGVRANCFCPEPIECKVPGSLKREPRGELNLEHTHEGLENNEYHSVK